MTRERREADYLAPPPEDEPLLWVPATIYLVIIAVLLRLALRGPP